MHHHTTTFVLCLSNSNIVYGVKDDYIRYLFFSIFVMLDCILHGFMNHHVCVLANASTGTNGRKRQESPCSRLAMKLSETTCVHSCRRWYPHRPVAKLHCRDSGSDWLCVLAMLFMSRCCRDASSSKITKSLSSWLCTHNLSLLYFLSASFCIIWLIERPAHSKLVTGAASGDTVIPHCKDR